MASSIPDLTVYCPECPNSIHGFPLHFYEIAGCPNTNVPECNPYGPRYNGLNFIIDIIFWYIISLILITIHYKITKK